MAQDLFAKLVWSGFGSLFLVVGLYTLNRGRKRRGETGRIADTETTRIRDLKPGTVEVKGTANAAENATAFESPIQRADALVAHTTVEEWKSSGQGGGSWRTIHEEERNIPITIDDGTGEVRVEFPQGRGLNLQQTRTEVGSGDEPPEVIRRYVENKRDVEEATRKSYGPLSLGDRRRYSEGIIEPGEEVYVLGKAREKRADWGERKFVIDEPTERGDFVLSDKSESDLIREGNRGGLMSLAFGALLSIIGAIFTVYPWLAA